MFVYSFTIEGYDVIVSIEFFSHVIVLDDSSLEPVDDDFEDADIFLIFKIINYWKFILLYFILPLEYLLLNYFTAGLFLYCSMLFIVLTCLL